MKRIIKLFKITVFLLSITLTFSNCVTLLGRGQIIDIYSSPKGAHVYARGYYIGTTPCSYKSKIVEPTLTFKKDGYSPKTISTATKMRGSIWWNLLFTGFFGVLVDIPYWEKYSTLVYHTELNAIPAPAPKTYTPKPIPTPTIVSSSVSEMKATAFTLSKIAISNSNIRMKSQAIFKKYNSAVFMIYTSNNRNISQGSGFFVTNDGIGISNYHVFKGCLKGKEIIKLSNGHTYQIQEVLAYSEQYDYIIFQVNGNGFNYIPITQRGYDVGDEIYTIGSPRGLENTFSSGEISQSRSNNLIQINAPIDHGSSGGALINVYGEVIGITSSGKEDSGANLNFAQDIRAIFDTAY